MPYTELKDIGELEECIKNSDENMVVIYYGATWCRPCVNGSEVFSVVSDTEEYDKIKFHKVDIDIIEEAKEHQEIVSIPVTIVYRNGKDVNRVVGTNIGNIIELIDSN